MVKNGIIKRYSAILHPHDLGFRLNFIVADVPDDESKELSAKIAECAQVQKVFLSGGGKMIIKTICSKRDQTYLDEVISMLKGYSVNVYPIDDVIKYEHSIDGRFIDEI